MSDWWYVSGQRVFVKALCAFDAAMYFIESMAIQDYDIIRKTDGSAVIRTDGELYHVSASVHRVSGAQMPFRSIVLCDLPTEMEEDVFKCAMKRMRTTCSVLGMRAIKEMRANLPALTSYQRKALHQSLSTAPELCKEEIEVLAKLNDDFPAAKRQKHLPAAAPAPTPSPPSEAGPQFMFSPNLFEDDD